MEKILGIIEKESEEKLSPETRCKLGRGYCLSSPVFY